MDLIVEESIPKKRKNRKKSKEEIKEQDIRKELPIYRINSEALDELAKEDERLGLK
jgi:hypothetical protein